MSAIRTVRMSDHRIFDEQIFGSLKTELGTRNTLEVLSAFLADTKAKIDACTASSMDRQLVGREAHSIKSSAGTFVVLTLSKIARDLEKDAPGMNPSEMEDSILALHAAFDVASCLAHMALTNLILEIIPKGDGDGRSS
jgi:HPt (histidine-containing phosphotransfer) domain-containing protein